MSTKGSPVDARRGQVDVDVEGVRVAVIAARFNAEITDSLLRGALEALSEHGARADDLTTIRVPGA